MRFTLVSPFSAKYPLYALRAYNNIDMFEEFLLISSKYNDYILDCPALEGNYAERRLKLLGMEKDLEFKLYPLRERMTSLSQLVNTTRRQFIDADGKLVKYRPSKFYQVQYTKVLRADRTWKGNFRLTTKLPVAFVTDRVSNYIGYIQIGSAFYLYGHSDTMQKPVRKKI